MKLQQMKEGQYFVFLPVALVRAKGWKKGEALNVEIDGKGNFIIREKQ